MDDSKLDEAVEWVNRLVRHGTLKTYISVGRFVLDQFFAGSIQLARTPRARGRVVTYKALQDHPRIEVADGYIGRAVRFVESLEVMGEDLFWELNVGHHVALLTVADMETRTNYALRALKEEWTGRQLAEHLQGDYPRQLEQPRRSIVNLNRRIERVRNSLAVSDLGPEDASASAREVNTMIEHLVALEARLCELAGEESSWRIEDDRPTDPPPNKPKKPTRAESHIKGIPGGA